MDTDKSGRTQNGQMYRSPIGTFYNYTMTVQRAGADDVAFDAFWEAISAPVASHICTFPYNRQTLTQRMYVTAGEQQLQLLRECGTALMAENEDGIVTVWAIGAKTAEDMTLQAAILEVTA